MKLQVAIDRVPVEQAVRIIQAIDGQADIIEIGTSLTKEFGLRALRPVLEAAGNTSVLADIKTCDEGAYEFDLGFGERALRDELGDLHGTDQDLQHRGAQLRGRDDSGSGVATQGVEGAEHR